MIIALSLAGCGGASYTSESAGEYLDASTTTAKIKAELFDHLGTDALAIQVKTFKEEVQLSGFVNSQFIKDHAGSVVAKNRAVKRVRNDLVVK